MFSKRFLLASALYGAISALSQSPAMAEKHIKLASCAPSPDAVASAGLATRNGKTVVSLTANFLGDAGCDVRPLKNRSILASQLYERPTTFHFDFNGNRPQTSFTLFVLFDYISNGRNASTQISFGDQNDFPLIRQSDGTYIATVTEKGLLKHSIRPDDLITKFTLDYRNADNTNPDFVSTIYVDEIKFLGEILPVDLKTAKAGCEVFN